MGCLAYLATVILSVVAAIEGWSFAWVLLAAVLSGFVALTSSPAYGMLTKADWEDGPPRLPVMLAFAIGGVLVISGSLYWFIHLFTR